MAKVFTSQSAYECEDMNRVESTIVDAYKQYVKSGYAVSPITEGNRNRTKETLIRVSDFIAIEENLKKLDMFGDFEKKNWFEGRPFDYTDANRYEQMRERLERSVKNIKQLQPVCGNAICGAA